MAEYSNVNRGAIWGNFDKDEDKQPDFKGSLNVEGKEYFVSAWKRKEGAPPKSPALSFSISPKDKSASGKAKPEKNEHNVLMITTLPGDPR